MNNNQRGPYFKYLRENLPIPRPTVVRRSQLEQNNLGAEEILLNNDGQINAGLQNNLELPADDDCMELDERRSIHSNHHVDGNRVDEFGLQEDVYMDLSNENLNEEASNHSESDQEVEMFYYDDVDAEIENELIDQPEDEAVQVEVIVEPNCQDDVIEDQLNDNQGERIPIYHGAPITKEESNHLIMGLTIRHNLNDTCVEDILDVINCHLPTTLHKSKYLFFKQFPEIIDAIPNYYCPHCMVEIFFHNNATTAKCSVCDRQYLLNSHRRNGHYFMRLPLKEQLQKLFSGPLFNCLQNHVQANNFETLSGIMTGAVYRELRQEEVIGPNDLTAQINLDGVQAFKSSKVSMCPIYIGINELGPRKMKENLILIGLWAATEKPDLNLFLAKVVDELNDLHVNGFQVSPEGFDKPITIKLHTILSPVDAVERCCLQNIHQFNGDYGCSLCLHPGEEVPVGRGQARMYRGGDLYPLRTTDQHLQDAIEAEETGEVINGVKGIAILMLLAIFNIVHSLPPEYMHCVLLGVVKTFLSFWTSSKNFLEPWYLDKEKVRIIDERMAQIKPPVEITRVPQSLRNLSKWKASEFRNFLLYYSIPCLKGVLPARFYKHWLLFVYAIKVFNSNEIRAEDYRKAKTSLVKFVEEIENLYGRIDLMKFNVHMMLHIPQAVFDYGPIWAWSAFPFEGYNRILTSMIHSSQSILSQICKSYLRLQSIKFDNTFCLPNCNPEAKTQYFKMMGKYRTKTGSRSAYDDKLILYGIGKIVNLSIQQLVEVRRVIRQDISEVAHVYERFLYKNILYHSSENSRLFKRNNSVIEIKTGGFANIVGIFRVNVLNSQIKNYVIIAKKFTVENESLCTNGDVDSSDFCHIVSETNNIIVIMPQDICNKCVIVPSFTGANNNLSVQPLVNTVESD